MLVHDAGRPLDWVVVETSDSPLGNPNTGLLVRFPLGAGNARSILLRRICFGDLGLRDAIKHAPLREGIITFTAAFLHDLPTNARAGEPVLTPESMRGSLFEPREVDLKGKLARCRLLGACLLLRCCNQEVECRRVV